MQLDVGSELTLSPSLPSFFPPASAVQGITLWPLPPTILSEIWVILPYFWSSPEYRLSTGRKRSIWAHRASFKAGLKNCVQLDHFQIGSWVHTAQQIDVRFYKGKKYMSLKTYLGSHEWEIIENSAVRRYFDGDNSWGLHLCDVIGTYSTVISIDILTSCQFSCTNWGKNPHIYTMSDLFEY